MIANYNVSKADSDRRVPFVLWLLLFYVTGLQAAYSQSTAHAIFFNGSNDYISLPPDPRLTKFTQISVELWLKPTSFDLGTWNQTEGLVGTGEGTNSFFLWITRNQDDQNGNARSFSQFRCDFQFGSAQVSSSWHPAGNWYHIAATYDGHSIRIFVNGVEEGAARTSQPLTVNSTEPIFIDHHTWNNGYASSQRVGGLIDEFRLWDRPLSSDEIKSTMNSELTGADHGLLVYYNFNDLAQNGSVAKDISPNAFNGTYHGSPRLVESDAPVQVSPAQLAESLRNKILSMENTIQQLKNNNVNTLPIEKFLSDSKDSLSKGEYGAAQKSLIYAQTYAQIAQSSFDRLSLARKDLDEAKQLGCDISTAESKLKESEDSLRTDGYSASQQLASEAIALSYKANCGKVAVQDLQAFASKYSYRTVTIVGEIKNIHPVYGQGYEFFVDDGGGSCRVIYRGSMKNISEGDKVTIEGTFTINPELEVERPLTPDDYFVNAAVISPQGFFTLFHIVLIVLLVGAASGGVYYRRHLLTLLSRVSNLTQGKIAGYRSNISARQSKAEGIAMELNKPTTMESRMGKSFNKYSAAIFTLAVLSFFLPFVRASFLFQSSQLSGFQLAFGAKNSDPEALAILCLIAILTGIGFAFMKGKSGYIFSAVSGGVGFILMLVELIRINSQAGGIAGIDYLAGFWIVSMLLLSTAALNIYNISTNRGRPTLQIATSKREEPIFDLASMTKKCPKCAEVIKFEAKVCRFCGHTFDENEVNASIESAKKQFEENKASEQERNRTEEILRQNRERRSW
ncbi:MAG: hypothetical protein M1470_00910 [Bacteroidetes bacterium]|nr:hypothetical protein [Bacteroidota bacterium]